MNEYLEDLRLVAQCGFTHNVNFAASAVLASMRYFRELSADLGVPMQDLRPDDILRDLSRLDRRDPRRTTDRSVATFSRLRGLFRADASAPIVIKVKRTDPDRGKGGRSRTKKA